jgi:hypothetical protein
MSLFDSENFSGCALACFCVRALRCQRIFLRASMGEVRSGQEKIVSNRRTKKVSFLTGAIAGIARGYWAYGMSIRGPYAHHFK